MTTTVLVDALSLCPPARVSVPVYYVVCARSIMYTLERNLILLACHPWPPFYPLPMALRCQPHLSKPHASMVQCLPPFLDDPRFPHLRWSCIFLPKLMVCGSRSFECSA